MMMFPPRLRWFGSALGFDFRTPRLPPLFEDMERRRESEFSGGGEFAHSSCVPQRQTALLLKHHVGVQRQLVCSVMPPQALVVYPPIAVLANALLAALNRLRLLAPRLSWVSLQTHSVPLWSRHSVRCSRLLGRKHGVLQRRFCRF